jgi:hypothetical protein
MPRPPGEKPPKPPTEAERREQRRAEALRANLRRRKASSGVARPPEKPDPAGDSSG